jgi:Uncharacterised protein family, YAP/Alf4/glomulin
MVVPFVGDDATTDAAEGILSLLAEKGNLKEVFLKFLEALKKVEFNVSISEEEEEDVTVIENTKADSLARDASDRSNEESDSIPGPLEIALAQTNVICDCIIEGIIVSLFTDVVLLSIQTKRPVRFWTTFYAAGLNHLSRAFQVIDNEETQSRLYDEFRSWIYRAFDEDDYAETDRKELNLLQKKVISHYVTIILKNPLLYWSARYWESSRSIPSDRSEVHEFIDRQLDSDIRDIVVRS